MKQWWGMPTASETEHYICMQVALDALWRWAHPAYWVTISALFTMADIAEREDDWSQVDDMATALVERLPTVISRHHIVHACALRRRGKARMKLANDGRRRARVCGEAAPIAAAKVINHEEMAVWAAEGRATWTGLLGMAVLDLEEARDVFVVCNGRAHESVGMCERWLGVCECMARGL